MKFPMDSAQVIPHRATMKLIGNIIQYGDNAGRVEARLDADGLFVGPDGAIETVAATELIAQACAAVNGLKGVESGKPPGRGYLVGVDAATFYLPIPAGETLIVDARQEFEVGDFGIFSGRIHAGTTLLAEARITVWAPPDDDED